MNSLRRIKPQGLPAKLNNLNRTLIVGVLNVTPDSFSDGGEFSNTKSAINQAQKLITQGADLIDVGGESTRPGANQISVDEELDRVLPVIKELKNLNILTSIDTMKSEVALAAINAGANLVNDVSGGLADKNMHKVVAKLDVPYVLMHWRGHSKNMDELAKYKNVTNEVIDEIQKQVQSALESGIRKEKIAIDPGLGFAKNPEHNWEILRNIDKLLELNLPLYIGASRKRFLAEFAIPQDSTDPKDRDIATSVVTTFAALKNVWAVRVHDVESSFRAVKLIEKLES